MFLLAFNPTLVPEHLVSNPSPARKGTVLCRGTPRTRARQKTRKRQRIRRGEREGGETYAQRAFRERREYTKYSMDEPSRRMLQVASFLQQRMTQVIIQCAHRNSVGMKRIPPSVDPKGIAITKVDVAPNLMNANIHVAIAGDRANQITTMRWLRTVTPVLRYEFGIASSDQMKKIPEFRFLHDDFGKTEDFKELLDKLATEAEQEEEINEEDIDWLEDEDMRKAVMDETYFSQDESMLEDEDEFWEQYYGDQYEFDESLMDDEERVPQAKKDKNLKDELLEDDEDEDAWLKDETKQVDEEKEWLKDEKAMWEDGDFEDEFEDIDRKDFIPGYDDLDGTETVEELADKILGRTKKGRFKPR